MSEQPVAVRLAEEVAAIARDDLPAPVLERALDLLRDYLGVALGGAGEESTVALRNGLATLHAGGRATVLGVADRLSAPHAALANGAAAHALEMDDTHQGGSIHLGATVFSAALAAAELADARGDTVLRAAVGGYEVAARLAMALRPAAHYGRGFHPTGTCGVFGAAAATALVFGLDRDGIAAALGIAGSQAAGSMEFLANGAWTKRLHPGWAALAGLHAAALARAGFRAPATIIEGRSGFLHAYTDGADAALLRPSGGYELLRTSIKPHACCRYMQGPIDAALALRAAHRLDPSNVARIEIGMLAAGHPIVCEPVEANRRPRSVVDAQFSLPFGVSVALVSGSASPSEFTGGWLTEPAVLDLADRVTAVRDARLDAVFPRQWPSWVRVILRDGTVRESAVAHPRGDPENFPARAELDAKFETLARRALPVDRVAALASAIGDFSDASSVAPLLAAAALPR